MAYIYLRYNNNIQKSDIDKLVDTAHDKYANPVIQFKNTTEINMNFIRNLRTYYGDKIKIRIEGVYDSEMIKRYPERSKWFIEDSIYTIEEVSKIMSSIEFIESGMNSNWNDEQKLFYLIGKISSMIIYHPEYLDVDSKDIRSLRGLYSRKTVCAGYALILKEMCDRNNIECQYVRGATNEDDSELGWTTHAWNLVRLNGNLIGVDLTWVASQRRRGDFSAIENFANVNEFCKSHFPNEREKVQNYKENLKSIDAFKTRNLYGLVNKEYSYGITSYNAMRNDKGKFNVTLVGEKIVDNEKIYMYVYTKTDALGRALYPLIFYSQTNYARFNDLDWEKNYQLKKDLEDAKRNCDIKREEKIKSQLARYPDVKDVANKFVNTLFSRENLQRALDDGSMYLGRITPNFDNSTLKVVVDKNLANKLQKNSKTYKRSDGSSFVLEAWGKSFDCYRFRLYQYEDVNCCDMLKKYTIFSEENLLLDDRVEVANSLLTAERIKRKSKDAGGYVGYLASNNAKTYYQSKANLYSNGIYQRFKLERSDFKDYVDEISLIRLRKLSMKYAVRDNRVYDNYTNAELTDEAMKLQVLFAKHWIKSATFNDNFQVAFSDTSRELFDIINESIATSIRRNGNIDLLDVVSKVKHSEYGRKYQFTDQLLRRLFDPNSIDMIEECYRSLDRSSLVKHAKSQITVDQILSGKYDNNSQFLEVYQDASGNVKFR